MKTAFLFPGQGAQSVGMGKDLYEAFPSAKRLFDQAERITGLELKRLCFEGPDEELSRTDISQPAIYTVSAAVLAVVGDLLGEGRREQMTATHMAGLSLGEYTALYAAGAMDFETTLTLVTRRGELMQRAAAAVPSGMVSVIGLDEHQALELCNAAAQGEVLSCANFNCPGQIVLSGQAGACERAQQLAGEFGAKAALPLKVAGAFHSKLMAPAAEKFAEVLDDVTFADPRAELIANVDAKAYAGADDVAHKLLAQLTSPVRWHESMQNLLADGVEKFYEIGPGRVLAGLMKRVHRRADITNLNGRDALEALAKA